MGKTMNNGAGRRSNASPVSRRIAMKLDVEMPFEALILNRLNGVPASRQQEWLQGLLVLGFLNECRALRELQQVADAQSLGVAERSQSSNSTPREAVPAPFTSQADTDHQQQTPVARVASFASLRQVMG
jgi:hypothetical protein